MPNYYYVRYRIKKGEKKEENSWFSWKTRLIISYATEFSAPPFAELTQRRLIRIIYGHPVNLHCETSN